MLTRLKGKMWKTVGQLASDPTEGTDRVLDTLEGVQQLRVWTEELQSACLHLVALPSRQDVRRLQRSVREIRKRVAALDEVVQDLEAKREERAAVPERD